MQERIVGTFRRTSHLPSGADTMSGNAEAQGGVLNITHREADGGGRQEDPGAGAKD